MLVDIDGLGEKIDTGIYEAFHCWNIKDRIKSEYPFDVGPQARAYMQRTDEPTDEERDAFLALFNAEITPQDYGMCDDPHQIVERWPIVADSDRKFVIYGRYIGNEKFPDFRPHKNGAYIGNKVDDLEHYEYLYDHPDIDVVFSFRIIELKD